VLRKATQYRMCRATNLRAYMSVYLYATDGSAYADLSEIQVKPETYATTWYDLVNGVYSSLLPNGTTLFTYDEEG